MHLLLINSELKKYHSQNSIRYLLRLFEIVATTPNFITIVNYTQDEIK